MKEYIIWFLVIVVLCIFIYYLPPRIKDIDAIDTIVGEASNQDYSIMVCVAQAIRNRGTLQGVYGLHAKHNALESRETYQLAGQAWEESELLKDQIRGAKNWGSMEDIVKLKIKLFKTRCGDLYFY